MDFPQQVFETPQHQLPLQGLPEPMPACRLDSDLRSCLRPRAPRFRICRPLARGTLEDGLGNARAKDAGQSLCIIHLHEVPRASLAQLARV